MTRTDVLMDSAAPWLDGEEKDKTVQYSVPENKTSPYWLPEEETLVVFSSSPAGQILRVLLHDFHLGF